MDLASCLNDALGNSIALHDASKDIHEDCFHLGMLTKDLESSFDLRGGCSTANVQEVGWLASLELNDVHGCHGETSSVDHAPDVTIESDVV